MAWPLAPSPQKRAVRRWEPASRKRFHRFGVRVIAQTLRTIEKRSKFCRSCRKDYQGAVGGRSMRKIASVVLELMRQWERVEISEPSQFPVSGRWHGSGRVRNKVAAPQEIE